MISKMKNRAIGWFSAATATVLTALPLHAHHLPPGMEDIDEFEDGAAFMAGIRHFVSGADHWLFAVAIGAMAVTVMRRRNAKNLMVALALGAGVGTALGVNQVMIPGASWSVFAAFLAPALVWCLKDSLSGWGKAGLVMLAAVWQGNQHGLAWPLDSASGFYTVGILSTLMVFVAGGYGLAWALRKMVVALSSRRLIGAH
ncbi:Hydrogenase/urease accessory protein HupE [Prosthecobacter debontii]|uniref:Hydrogenase/urease accessory protein HupE n=2 Tax=Prosthecobacter debontii TaxID=48467 RepID=A0A1T4YIN4_9BACT|nr:Hydrogenase/urease accessory protein HupE [Prosthecobacter debontii]